MRMMQEVEHANRRPKGKNGLQGNLRLKLTPKPCNRAWAGVHGSLDRLKTSPPLFDPAGFFSPCDPLVSTRPDASCASELILALSHGQPIWRRRAEDTHKIKEKQPPRRLGSTRNRYRKTPWRLFGFPSNTAWDAASSKATALSANFQRRAQSWCARSALLASRYTRQHVRPLAEQSRPIADISVYL
ncbi:uncharacterized protein VTP21DRAFT_6110 [Calcarisporiella thermophila]|uniref:uncharacterized protein n=1 Tax=Calcarisporiella thermophila TaxID=911321 RepID=UPI0037426A03